MAAEVEPRSGLVVGFDLDEEPWDTQIEATLNAIARLKMGGGVIDRDLTAPPGSESPGDAYIVGPAATGDWAGLDDAIVVYTAADTFVTYNSIPDGFGIFILDENVYSVYKSGSGWSDGVSHAWT